MSTSDDIASGGCEEAWLPVIGYEKTYEISSLGRVRRSARGRSTHPGRLLRQFPIWKAGHLGVSLCQDAKQKTFPVHKIVALAWKDPPPDLIDVQIHHINEDCTDNRARNIEYTDARPHHAHTMA